MADQSIGLVGVPIQRQNLETHLQIHYTVSDISSYDYKKVRVSKALTHFIIYTLFHFCLHIFTINNSYRQFVLFTLSWTQHTNTHTKHNKHNRLMKSALALSSVMYARQYEFVSVSLDMGRITTFLMGEPYVGPRRVFLCLKNTVIVSTDM